MRIKIVRTNKYLQLDTSKIKWKKNSGIFTSDLIKSHTEAFTLAKNDINKEALGYANNIESNIERRKAIDIEDNGNIIKGFLVFLSYKKFRVNIEFDLFSSPIFDKTLDTFDYGTLDFASLSLDDKIKSYPDINVAFPAIYSNNAYVGKNGLQPLGTTLNNILDNVILLQPVEKEEVNIQSENWFRWVTKKTLPRKIDWEKSNSSTRLPVVFVKHILSTAFASENINIGGDFIDDAETDAMFLFNNNAKDKLGNPSTHTVEAVTQGDTGYYVELPIGIYKMQIRTRENIGDSYQYTGSVAAMLYVNDQAFGDVIFLKETDINEEEQLVAEEDKPYFDEEFIFEVNKENTKLRFYSIWDSTIYPEIDIEFWEYKNDILNIKDDNIVLAEHVNNITLTELLKALQNKFKLRFSYNPFSKTYNVDYVKNVFTSPSYELAKAIVTDITAEKEEGYIIELEEPKDEKFEGNNKLEIDDKSKEIKLGTKNLGKGIVKGYHSDVYKLLNTNDKEEFVYNTALNSSIFGEKELTKDIRFGFFTNYEYTVVDIVLNWPTTYTGIGYSEVSKNKIFSLSLDKTNAQKSLFDYFHKDFYNFKKNAKPVKITDYINASTDVLNNVSVIEKEGKQYLIKEYYYNKIGDKLAYVIDAYYIAPIYNQIVATLVIEKETSVANSNTGGSTSKEDTVPEHKHYTADLYIDTDGYITFPFPVRAPNFVQKGVATGSGESTPMQGFFVTKDGITKTEIANGDVIRIDGDGVVWDAVNKKFTIEAGGVSSWNDLTDKPSTFAPSTHNHSWDSVTGKPSTFAPSSHAHSWDSVTNKPTTYTPSTHNHTIAHITDLEDRLYEKANKTELDAYDDRAYVQSRGEQLITNNTGHLEDNTNFSVFEFRGDLAHGGKGGFYIFGNGLYPVLDEYIPVDATVNYNYDFWYKAAPLSVMYMLLKSYDIDGRGIFPWQYARHGTTLLTQDVNVGDTVIHVEDVSHFNNTNSKYSHGIIVHNYKNSFGYLYPDGGYSRNFLGKYSRRGYGDYNTGIVGNAIDVVNNTITLNTPYAGPIINSGTAVSNARDGGGYIYPKIYGVGVDGWDSWSKAEAVVYASSFHKGTAFIQVGAVVNKNNPNPELGHFVIADVSFSKQIIAASATKLATARTITLAGDATGSFSFDGTANKTLTVTVANDSHTHDGRYYTENESNSRFAYKAGTSTQNFAVKILSSESINIQDLPIVKNADGNLEFTVPIVSPNFIQKGVGDGGGGDTPMQGFFVTKDGVSKTEIANGDVIRIDGNIVSWDAENKKYTINGISSINWADVENKPSTFAPSSHAHSWASITSKPSTFAPSSHAHSWASITSKPSLAQLHSHANNVTLAKFGEDAQGLPTYNGLDIDTTIAQRDVYDGLDSNDNTISLSANNGKVLNTLISTAQAKADSAYTLANSKFTSKVANTTLGLVKSGTDITVDSSGNVSVNNDSHTHDGRYYTENESNSRYAYKSGTLGQAFKAGTIDMNNVLSINASIPTIVMNGTGDTTDQYRATIKQEWNWKRVLSFTTGGGSTTEYTAMTFGNTGRVAIGGDFTDATYHLDVLGRTRIQGALAVGGSYDSAYTFTVNGTTKLTASLSVAGKIKQNNINRRSWEIGNTSSTAYWIKIGTVNFSSAQRGKISLIGGSGYGSGLHNTATMGEVIIYMNGGSNSASYPDENLVCRMVRIGSYEHVKAKIKKVTDYSYELWFYTGYYSSYTVDFVGKMDIISSTIRQTTEPTGTEIGFLDIEARNYEQSN